MTGLPQITSMMDAVLIPMTAAIALLFAKLTRGPLARKAEKNFYACLVVMTVITVRTVILCEDFWLIHTTTLAIMIVGALVIPGHDWVEGGLRPTGSAGPQQGMTSSLT